MKRRIYTKTKLEKVNAVYLSDYSHRIEQSDVQFVNQCIGLMYNALCFVRPKVGDIVQYTTKDGIYYPHAHIDCIENGVASVCLSPFIPFVYIRDGEIRMDSVSGGPWVQVPVSELVKSGAESKWFHFFGSSGVCSHGAIQFEGYANCWEYKEEGLFFGEYSTKLYNRTVFRKIDGKWYLTETTDSENMPDSEDFEQWIQETKGVQFGLFEKDETVTVFAYKENHMLVPLEFWKLLDKPMGWRRINGRNKVRVKFDVNDKTKTVTVYRFTNS